jgi:hypothetical protein
MQSANVSTPWALRLTDEGAFLDAFVNNAGAWVTIAAVGSQPSFDAQHVAAQIIRAVNNEETYRRVLDDMAGALEACLNCNGLDFTAEHDSEIALARYKVVTGR